jgi:hypothetical protein
LGGNDFWFDRPARIRLIRVAVTPSSKPSQFPSPPGGRTALHDRRKP